MDRNPERTMGRRAAWKRGRCAGIGIRLFPIISAYIPSTSILGFSEQGAKRTTV